MTNYSCYTDRPQIRPGGCLLLQPRAGPLPRWQVFVASLRWATCGGRPLNAKNLPAMVIVSTELYFMHLYLYVYNYLYIHTSFSFFSFSLLLDAASGGLWRLRRRVPGGSRPAGPQRGADGDRFYWPRQCETLAVGWELRKMGKGRCFFFNAIRVIRVNIF